MLLWLDNGQYKSVTKSLAEVVLISYTVVKINTFPLSPIS